jgi:hypothetical protein
MIEAYVMRCRPYGNDWGPCAWCGGEKDLIRTNFASFVSGGDLARISEMFVGAGLDVVEDSSRADEGRYQIKVMACEKHVINLRLLRELIVVNSSKVTERLIKFTIV